MPDILTLEIEKQAKARGLYDLLEVYYRIRAVGLPDRVDAIFLVPNTEDNEWSIFTGAKSLERLSQMFLILDGAEANGYPGFENWYRRFSDYVNSERIRMVPIADRHKVNTLSKFKALVPWAMEQGITSVCLVPAPFHYLRTFMTAASVAIREGVAIGGVPELRIYPHAGAEQPWDEFVYHSQGIVWATRREFVRIELDQIVKYQRDGKDGLPNSIEPTARILEYVGTLA